VRRRSAPIQQASRRYLGWGPKPMVAVDIFRIANGKIAEHWDVMQEEVPAAQSANGNSMLTSEHA
jgi:predicted SnoaL-like aldol condensation-catalyzing enzyme